MFDFSEIPKKEMRIFWYSLYTFFYKNVVYKIMKHEVFQDIQECPEFWFKKDEEKYNFV